MPATKPTCHRRVRMEERCQIKRYQATEISRWIGQSHPSRALDLLTSMFTTAVIIKVKTMTIKSGLETLYALMKGRISTRLISDTCRRNARVGGDPSDALKHRLGLI